MKYLLSIGFAFLVTSSKAQISFIPDNSFKPNKNVLIEKLDSLFGIDQDFDFRFRFNELPSLGRYVKFYQLILKNNIWAGRYFYLDRFTRGWTEKKISQDEIQNVWKKMIGSHLLDMKLDEEIKDSVGNIAYTPVFDGTSFHFEIMDKSGGRAFYIRCPKVQAETYPYIPEFKWILNLIDIIHEHMNEKDVPTCMSTDAHNIGFAESLIASNSKVY